MGSGAGARPLPGIEPVDVCVLATTAGGAGGGGGGGAVPADEVVVPATKSSPSLVKRSATSLRIVVAAAISLLPGPTSPLRLFASPRPYNEAARFGSSRSAA